MHRSSGRTRLAQLFALCPCRIAETFHAARPGVSIHILQIGSPAFSSRHSHQEDAGKPGILGELLPELEHGASVGNIERR